MVAQDPSTEALLAHVLSQTEANVRFLANHNYISHVDADAFLVRLSAAAPTPRQQFSFPTPSAPSPIPVPVPAPASAPTPALAPVQLQPIQQARAIWPYNENHQEPNDLSFPSGAIIDIVEETNPDWWTGRYGNRTALFPAAYVEKLPPPPSVQHGPTPIGKPTTPYRPFGAALHGTDVPPPAGTGVNSIGLQQTPAASEEKKKNKFGKLGSTMGQAAAGGVGFGAGAAIGSGIINSIF